MYITPGFPCESLHTPLEEQRSIKQEFNAG